MNGSTGVQIVQSLGVQRAESAGMQRAQGCRGVQTVKGSRECRA